MEGSGGSWAEGACLPPAAGNGCSLCLCHRICQPQPPASRWGSMDADFPGIRAREAAETAPCQSNEP